jgi:hypothetical protein
MKQLSGKYVKPALVNRVLIANSAGWRTVPLANGRHGLDARFKKGVGQSGFDE